MRLNYMTGAEFNRFPSEAKKRAADAPVVITERGVNSHVLMTYADYQENVRPKRTLLDLAHPESADIDLDIERDGSFGREVDFG